MLVISDLDGTIINSEPTVHKVVAQIFEDLGYIIPFEEISSPQHNGVSVPDKLYQIAQTCSIELPNALRETIANSFKKKMSERFQDGDFEVFDGLHAAWEKLRQEGHVICVVSNLPSDVTRIVLEKANLMSHVSGVYGPNDNNGQGKPDPGIYAKALARHPTHKAVICEDSIVGVQGARNADILCLVHAPHSLADTDISKFRELGIVDFFSDYKQLSVKIDALAARLSEPAP